MICRCLIQAAPSSMFTHGRRKEGGTEKCDHNGGLVQLLLNDFNHLRPAGRSCASLDRNVVTERA